MQLEKDFAANGPGHALTKLQKLWEKLWTPFPYDRKLIPDDTLFYSAEFSRQRERMYLLHEKDGFSQATRSRIAWEVLMRTVSDEHDRQKGIYRLLNQNVYLAAYPLHDVSEFPRIYATYFESWATWVRNYLQFLSKNKSSIFFGVFLGANASAMGVTSESSRLSLCDWSFGLLIDLKQQPDWLRKDNNTLRHTPCLAFIELLITLFLGLGIVWERSIRPCNRSSHGEEGKYWMKYVLHDLAKTKKMLITNTSGHRRLVTPDSLSLFPLPIFSIDVDHRRYRPHFFSTSDVATENSWKNLIMVLVSILRLFNVLLNFWYIKRHLVLTPYCGDSTILFDLRIPLCQSSDGQSNLGFCVVHSYLLSSQAYIPRPFRFAGHPGKEGTLFGYSLDKCEGGCLYEVCVQLAIVMVGKQVINNIQEIGQPLFMNWWRSWRRDRMRREVGDQRSSLSRWEADYNLQPWTTLSLFDEYLEMAIQFGFVTLFVAAFPLAPLFALLNNIVEIRLDAYKYTSQLRRPLAQRVPNIGAWQVILKGVSIFAVVCNAFLIAYTSDFTPRILYRMVHSGSHSLRGYVNFTLAVFDTKDFDDDARPENGTLDGVVVKQCRYLDYREPPGGPSQYQLTLTYWHIFAARLFFVVVFEHVVFSITGLVAAIIPDVPRSVQQRIKREQIVSQEVFNEADRASASSTNRRRGSRSASASVPLSKE
ncbi:unnamed protein product [Ixodes persulcatus]